jgi:hypothetical protein
MGFTLTFITHKNQSRDNSLNMSYVAHWALSEACLIFATFRELAFYFIQVIVILLISVWNKEELPDQWKKSTIVPIHKKGDKTDCSKYRGISLLSTSYKI